MSENTKIVVDCSTGITTIVELTPEEISQRELDSQVAIAQMEESRLQREALEALKSSAKAKLVAGESLTEEEASVLLA